MSDLSPRVSVIVPAHDVAAFIAPCLDSVLAQTMPDLEVLVVDDASADGTAERVAAFDDPRVRCLRSPENRGPSAARNRAIDAARGEWLALLDADDAWLPERLERLVATGRERRSDLVVDDVALTDAELRPTGETVLGQRGWRPAAVHRVSAAELVRHDLGFLKPIFRRSFLAEHRLRFDESLRHGEDFELMWRCLRRGARYDLLPEPYYLHRLRPGSLTSQRIRLFETTRATTKNLLAEPELAEEPELAAALGARLARIECTLAYNRCRAALAGRAPLRAARELRGTPGALQFTLRQALRGLGRRIRVPRGLDR